MWKSTFCKYGPCSNLTQTEYFQRALELRQKLDLLNYLATKGYFLFRALTSFLFQPVQSTIGNKLETERKNRNKQKWSSENDNFSLK